LGNGLNKTKGKKMTTVTLESVMQIATHPLLQASIHFGRVGHGTKVHIIRKTSDLPGCTHTLCGAETSRTSMRRSSYAYTIRETEVPASTVCGRCLKTESEVA
jgi:hypothetical protein